MDWGGYFCVLLLLQRPMANPTLKQVKPKLNTAIKVSIVTIAIPSFLRFPFGFLCERRVAVPPERANRLPSMAAPWMKYNRILEKVQEQNHGALLKGSAILLF